MDVEIGEIGPDDTEKAVAWFVAEWTRTKGKVDPGKAESVIGALEDPTDYLARVAKFLESKG